MQNKSTGELISFIHLTHKRYLERQILKYDLSIKQFYLLKKLKNKTLPPSTIAKILFADRPTTTVILNNLEKKGLIEIEQNLSDKRGKIISLSSKGTKKIKETKLEKINLTACLSHEENVILKELLTKISINLNKKEEKNDFRD